MAAEKHLAQVEDDSDFEEDLALVTGKKLNKTDRKSRRKHEEGDSDNVIGNSEDQIDDEDDEIGDSEDQIDDEIGNILVDNQ